MMQLSGLKMLLTQVSKCPIYRTHFTSFDNGLEKTVPGGRT